MLLFTSDTHFGHPRLAELRGFASTHEMNVVLTERWNARVRKNDEIWVLGDFALGKEPEAVFHKLNGHKNLVAGNHDDKRVLRLPWDSVQHYRELKDNHELFVLSHYAFAVWNKSHYGSLHLHGHSHGSLPATSRDGHLLRRMDVGVDTHGLAPYTLEEIREVLHARPLRQVDYHKPRDKT